VRAAIQEDVRAIGLSSYNGGHVEFFSEVLSLLRSPRGNIGVFGGVVELLQHDARLMKRRVSMRSFSRALRWIKWFASSNRPMARPGRTIAGS